MSEEVVPHKYTPNYSLTQFLGRDQIAGQIQKNTIRTTHFMIITL
jgi:hypothetical protein